MGQRYGGERVFPGAGPSLGAQLELALSHDTAPCCEYPLVHFQNPLERLQPVSGPSTTEPTSKNPNLST